MVREKSSDELVTDTVLEKIDDELQAVLDADRAAEIERSKHMASCICYEEDDPALRETVEKLRSQKKRVDSLTEIIARLHAAVVT